MKICQIKSERSIRRSVIYWIYAVYPSIISKGGKIKKTIYNWGEWGRIRNTNTICWHCRKISKWFIRVGLCRLRYRKVASPLNLICLSKMANLKTIYSYVLSASQISVHNCIKADIQQCHKLHQYNKNRELVWINNDTI